MKKLLLLSLALCFSASVAFSQGISLGLRGGLTLTSGNTTIPAQPAEAIPELVNDGDGFGTGFLFGVTSKFKLGGFFLLGEINYSRFLLKQKNTNDISLTLAPGVTGQASFNIKSETTLDAINVPILFGKSFAKGLVRAYIGPSFIFTSRAEQVTNGSLSAGGIPITEFNDEKTDLLDADDAGILEVKPLIVAIEVGAGLSLPMGLEVDLRYGIPAITGVYKNSDVKGFLGILSLSVGYRLVKLGL